MWKIWLILVAATGVASAWAGYSLHSPEIETRTLEVAGQEKVVWKDRIITVTKETRPDGTSKETTITQDKSTSSAKEETIHKKVDQSQGRMATRASEANSYSLALHYAPTLPMDWARVDRYQITLGYRLIGDMWLEGGYRIEHDLTIGVRYEW